jgi:hypothetical protein
MSHVSAASKALNINRQYTTLKLIGGYDCLPGRKCIVPDLDVEGGARIKKRLCVNNIDLEGDLVVGGNLLVLGDSSVHSVETIISEDHNICLGNVTGGMPTNATANGGGITVLGPQPGESKSIAWYQDLGPVGEGVWRFNQDIDLGSGRQSNNPGCGSDDGLSGVAYRIDDTVVINISSLGETIINSNLERVGTLRFGEIRNVIPISSIDVGTPIKITTSEPHLLTTGDCVTLSGTNSTPAADGCAIATVLNDMCFTIPGTTIGAGTTGFVQSDNFPIDIGTSELRSGTHTVRCAKDLIVEDALGVDRFHVFGESGVMEIDNVLNQSHAALIESCFSGDFTGDQHGLRVTN